MIFETHAHYDDAKFDTDREMLLAELPQRGISPVINAGSSIATTKTTLSLAQEYPFLYAAVGVHPSDVDDLNEDTYAWLRQQTTLQKTVAVGEIGLDYYWDKEPEIQAKQRYWFVRQLALAQQADLPVIIHSRDAAEDTMQIMEKAYEDGIKGVIHCYSGSAQMAKEYVKLGYYIGVGGVVTFKTGRVLKEVVQTIPLEHILIETDCPYLSPVPNRGKRNSSLNLPYVVEEIARLKGISVEEAEEVTFENAKKMYRL